jgi:hypothetical protein
MCIEKKSEKQPMLHVDGKITLKTHIYTEQQDAATQHYKSQYFLPTFLPAFHVSL